MQSYRRPVSRVKNSWTSLAHHALKCDCLWLNTWVLDAVWIRRGLFWTAWSVTASLPGSLLACHLYTCLLNLVPFAHQNIAASRSRSWPSRQSSRSIRISRKRRQLTLNFCCSESIRSSYIFRIIMLYLLFDGDNGGFTNGFWRESTTKSVFFILGKYPFWVSLPLCWFQWQMTD